MRFQRVHDENSHRLNMKNIVWLIITATFLFASCQGNDEVPDGGFCSYQSTFYPAVIISLDTLTDERMDLSCVLTSEQGSDTLIYSLVNSNHLLKTEWLELDLSIGDTICYEHRQIVEGSCNPDIFTLKLERFKSVKSEDSTAF
jgi:hypothetical protein